MTEAINPVLVPDDETFLRSSLSSTDRNNVKRAAKDVFRREGSFEKRNYSQHTLKVGDVIECLVNPTTFRSLFIECKNDGTGKRAVFCICDLLVPYKRMCG